MAKVFFENKVTIGDKEYLAGEIYHVENEKLPNGDVIDKVSKLTKQGGQLVDFANVQAVEHTLSRLVSKFKQEEEKLANNPRYRDNEAEREYQLEQLKVKFDEDVQTVQAEYQKELAVTEAELATKVINTVPTVDIAVQSWLDTELALMAYTGDIVGDLTLFETKVNALQQEQYFTVLKNVGKLAQLAKGNKQAEEVLGRIVAKVKQNDEVSTLNSKLKQVRALKADGILNGHLLYQRVKGKAYASTVRVK